MATKNDFLQTLASEYALAWSSGNPAEVAGFFAADGTISVNRGEAAVGTRAITEMAAGFHAAFPGLEFRCDLMRCAGHRAVFVWTLEGHHAETKNHVVVTGWDEWEFDEQMKVRSSLCWFDANDCRRQAEGH